MPRVRSSATSARMSLTCHAAWVCCPAVPGAALGHVQVGAAAAPEHDGVLVFLFDQQPEFAVVELSGCGEVPGQQHGGDRMLSEHGCSCCVACGRSASSLRCRSRNSALAMEVVALIEVLDEPGM